MRVTDFETTTQGLSFRFDYEIKTERVGRENPGTGKQRFPSPPFGPFPPERLSSVFGVEFRSSGLRNTLENPGESLASSTQSKEYIYH